MTVSQFNRRLWLVAISLLLVSGAVAQSPPAAPNPYTPSEVQQLRLKVAQQSAQLAQAQLREAQQAFQSALANLSSEAEKVRLENKWPEDVQVNLDTLAFSKKPSPPDANFGGVSGKANKAGSISVPPAKEGKKP